MLELKNISKTFQERMILNDISLQFPDTGFVGIQGESGCGKSTLLYIIGMLDDKFEGEVFYNGEKILDKDLYIRQHVSYMMQNKDIIDALTVRENILLSSKISQCQYQESYFQKIVKQLEIHHLLNAYPHQLSGGQLKRVSIAKALLKQSTIILCDEPTGALHQKQAHEVMKLLKNLSQKSLVIMVSHDQQLLKQYCDCVLTLDNGHIKGKVKKKKVLIEIHRKKHYYSLWFYTMRQIIYQKHKLVFLFIFQWIVIVAFFLIVTAMNGVFDAIERSETNAVNTAIFTIEKKRSEFFEKPSISIPSYQNFYDYHLDQITLQSSQQKISGYVQFMPSQTSHIKLKQGHLPQSIYEVIVSESLYNQLTDKNSLTFSFDKKTVQVKIVGVIEPYLFQGEEVYCSRLLEKEMLVLQNRYALSIEAPLTQSRQLYQQLENTYIVYSDVIERVDNYQSLLSLGSMVAYVFIMISFMISLLLIAIVESIIYFERKHDVAYLLSLGLFKRRLFLMSLFESMMLGFIMAVGGCLFSKLLFYYLNDVYLLFEHFSFELVIKPIFFSVYDLYILILISYMIMGVLAGLLPILKMMKTHMIDVLREE